MTPEVVIDLARKTVEAVLLLSAPMLLSGMIVGLVISIFQAATQINEQTLTFIPKIVVVLATLLIFGPWMIKVLLAFTHGIFNQIATLKG